MSDSPGDRNHSKFTNSLAIRFSESIFYLWSSFCKFVCTTDSAKCKWNMVTAYETSKLIKNPCMQADHYARDSLIIISSGFQTTTSDAFNPAS